MHTRNNLSEQRYNTTPPIISVVIPMYNVESYIAECLQSVLNQSFESYEVICVDDGCTDGTVNVVQRFTDPRIKIVSQKNRGLSGARNTGINTAHAPYIALLDADDRWHPHKLEKHFQHLCSSPEIGVSYSASSFIDDSGSELGIYQRPKLKSIDAQHILCRNPVGNGSAPVIRKIALNDIAFEKEDDGEMRRMYFNESLRQSEDIELWVRLALNTQWRFEGIGEELTYYRLNASGLSANLEKQLQNWSVAMELNYPGHETFFDINLSLARAYQKRYLARRAIQSHDGINALSLVSQALATDIRILRQEPIRTLVTAVCACLALLPSKIYDSLQNIGIQLLASRAT